MTHTDPLTRVLSWEAATLEAWFQHKLARSLWSETGFAGHPRHYLIGTDGLTDVQGLIIGGTREGADWDRGGLFRIFTEDRVIATVDGNRAQELRIEHRPEVMRQVFPSAGAVPCRENTVQNLLIASRLAMMFHRSTEARRVWATHVQRVYAQGGPVSEERHVPTQLVWIGEDDYQAAALVLDGTWIDELVGFSTFRPMIVLVENEQVVRVDPACERILNAERIR
ncbi:hypothetical protein [Acetobacter sicerae]|uniref:hypothetical protein n=1 Tax=Acetobacter sicerae TaxID=85325 RepID=UPI00156B9FA6|nr:hypothetical protein [Acetobacter sicerae]NHN93548.1 hypothetical protein [Acetobacter sicerae]